LAAAYEYFEGKRVAKQIVWLGETGDILF